jgi:5'-deoxynucleotidase YfbR-like HD superfamily hydrolase
VLLDASLYADYASVMPKSTSKNGQHPSRAYQRMLSGRRLDILTPSPLDIEIQDIAHGLARVSRWNGQTTGRYGYSVAQHSVLVERLFSRNSPSMPQKWRLACLLHDAAEYVIGDMITPFKAALGADYKKIEKRLEEAVHIRFGLPAILPQKIELAIKRADRMSAYIEATQIAGFSADEAIKLFTRPRGTPADFDVTPLAPDAAARAFLRQFSLLAGS